jgi:hypothetical protein
MKHKHSAAGRAQHAGLSLTIADRAVMSVAVTVTPQGLLAIGGLVSAILLSTAVLVRAARHPS